MQVRRKRLTLGAGWHTFGWSEPKRPGVYPVHVTAIDSTGNKAAFDALPIVRVVPAKKTPAKMRSTAMAPPTAVAPSFAVGAGLDDPSQGPLAQKAGLHLVRLGITWPAGATAPDPTAIAALAQLPPSLGVVVELNAAPLPVDDAGRAALAQYAAALAQQVPSLRYLVLGPAATTATAAAYAAALDRPAAGGSGVGAGRARRSVTRRQREREGNDHGTRGHRPLIVVAFRPAPAVGKGLWTFANLPQLSTALTAAYGVAPPVLVDGLAPPVAASISAAACIAESRRRSARPPQRRHAGGNGRCDRGGATRRNRLSRARNAGGRFDARLSDDAGQPGRRATRV